MGTRHLTVFIDCVDNSIDNKETEIAVLYGQWDGYPTGYGEKLKDFLKKKKIVNGIPYGGDTSDLANGMGCLAAQVISHFKKEAGGFYLHPAGTRDIGEEYVYILRNKNGRIYLTLEVFPHKVIFKGLISKFDPEKAESQDE